MEEVLVSGAARVVCNLTFCFFFVLLKPNKTVFIEMPAFEYEDQPEYVEIKEDGVDSIVIDDSD